MSSIFQGRCPFCGHKFRVRLAHDLTPNMKVKVACPNCKEKSIPTDIDGNGLKVLVIPEQATPQGNTVHASDDNDTCSNDTARATEEKIDDTLKARSEFHSRVRTSLFHNITRFLSENPILAFNALFVGLWIAFIVAVLNSTRESYYRGIEASFQIIEGEPIAGVIAMVISVLLFMIPGGFLGWIKDKKIQEDKLKHLFGTTTNLVSFSLILFIGFSLVGDYSNIQRKQTNALGRQKADVLLALHEKNCKLAKEHYQTYKDTRGSDHPSLAPAIQSCLID